LPGRSRARPPLVFAAVVALLLVPSAAAGPPEITVTISGTLGSNGWYTSNVSVGWDVTGETFSDGCNTRFLTTDTVAVRITCFARDDNDGTETSKTVTVKIDKTSPTVTSAPARAPDANGWYTRPVAVSFSGTDATSGISSCSSTGYAGPDNPGAVITGFCRDTAGNVGTAAYALKYDATPPTVGSVTTKAINHGADISWKASADSAIAEVTRAPGVKGAGSSVIYRGTASSFRDSGLKAGLKYTYQVAVLDAAGNRSGAIVKHVGTSALLRPAPAERVTRPPRLVWAPKKGARYYNVLLMRGRKVLSAWPRTTSLQLKRTWVMGGRRYRLRPGVYRWYVWPGVGKLAAGKYGRSLGGSTIVYAG
jgi:hypothetical protein